MRKDGNPAHRARHDRQAPDLKESPEGMHYILLEISDNLISPTEARKEKLAHFRHELEEYFRAEKRQTQELTKLLQREQNGKQILYAALVLQSPLNAETIRQCAELYGRRYEDVVLHTLVLEKVQKSIGIKAINHIEAHRDVFDKSRGNIV